MMETPPGDDNARPYRWQAVRLTVWGFFFLFFRFLVSPAAGDVVPGDLDSGFGGSAGIGSHIDAPVKAIVSLSDGGYLIGGDFTALAGRPQGGLARLTPEGFNDPAFMDGASGANGTVNAIEVQDDGRILAAGAFNSFNGEPCGSIVRLHPEGFLDRGFLASAIEVNGPIFAVRVQDDGKILIGGSFTRVNGVARERVARLHDDGRLDDTFNTQLSGFAVDSLALLEDGAVLVAGRLDRGVARLKPNGSVDPDFKAQGWDALTGTLTQVSHVHSWVASIGVRDDGFIVAAVTFAGPMGLGPDGGYVRLLHPDGTVDESFNSGIFRPGTLDALLLQENGGIIIGGRIGSFTYAEEDPVELNGFARLHADGTVDTDFIMDSDAPFDFFSHRRISVIAEQPDGGIMLGGVFDSIGGVVRDNIARLEAGGGLDDTFRDRLPGVNGTVHAIATLEDGRILIGGEFTAVHGVPRNRIARLFPDGSLDDSFLNGLAGADRTVNAVVVQSDGRIIIGGRFLNVNGRNQLGFTRLLPDGGLDPEFTNAFVGASLTVNSIGLQTDGKIVIGGSFYSNPHGGTFTGVAGIGRGIGRLNSNGSLDNSFLVGRAGPSSTVLSLAIQEDGKILIGGLFTQVDGIARSRIARLHPGGELDDAYLINQDGISTATCHSVRRIVLQEDGKALIGGTFTRVNGVTRHALARLNSDGTLDESFLDGLAGVDNSTTTTCSATVRAIAVQSDGKVLVGGGFPAVNGVPRNGLARLNPDGSLDEVFLDGRAGTAGTLYDVAFQENEKILAGGHLAVFNGTARNNLVRLYGQVNFDVWRNQYFTDDDANDPEVSGPLVQTGPMGRQNLLHYALGQNPHAFEKASCVTVQLESAGPVLIYERPASRPDILYVAESSSDLKSWSSENVLHELREENGATEIWAARSDAVNGRIFYRLRIRQVD